MFPQLEEDVTPVKHIHHALVGSYISEKHDETNRRQKFDLPTPPGPIIVNFMIVAPAGNMVMSTYLLLIP